MEAATQPFVVVVKLVSLIRVTLINLTLILKLSELLLPPEIYQVIFRNSDGSLLNSP